MHRNTERIMNSAAGLAVDHNWLQSPCFKTSTRAPSCSTLGSDITLHKEMVVNKEVNYNPIVAQQAPAE